jgi:transposase
LTGGNRNDITQLISLLQAVPPVRGKRGRPRRRPDVVLGDRGYDHDKYRRLVWDLGVKPVIARRSTEHGSELGTQRWVVNARSPTCTGSAACGSAGRYATTSTKPSSPSDAHSSAGDA